MSFINLKKYHPGIATRIGNKRHWIKPIGNNPSEENMDVNISVGTDPLAISENIQFINQPLIKVVRFAVDHVTASPFTQTIDLGEGFGKAECAIIIGTRVTANDTRRDHASFFISFVVSIAGGDGNPGNISLASRDNQSPGDSLRSYGSLACRLLNVDGTKTEDCFVAVDLDTEDEAKFIWATGRDPSEPWIFTLIAFSKKLVFDASGGVTNAYTFPSPVGVDTPSFLGPSDLIFHGSVHASIAGGIQNYAALSFGACLNDGSFTQKGIGIGDTDDDFSDIRTTVTALDGKMASQAYNHAEIYNIELTDILTSEYQLTATADPGSDEGFSSLALRFNGNYEIALFNVEIPSSGNYIETSPGFRPDFGLIALADVTAYNDSTQTGRDSIMVAAFGAGTEGEITHGSHSIAIEDGSDPTNTASYTSEDMIMIDGTGILIDATFDKFTDLGWDFIVNTNPGVARKGWGLAIGRRLDRSVFVHVDVLTITTYPATITLT